jgi:hypothetical protein
VLLPATVAKFAVCRTVCAVHAGCSSLSSHSSRRHQPDLQKARALGDALTLFSTVPWALCALVYSFLHCTYPRYGRTLYGWHPSAAAAIIRGSVRSRTQGTVLSMLRPTWHATWWPSSLAQTCCGDACILCSRCGLEHHCCSLTHVLCVRHRKFLNCCLHLGLWRRGLKPSTRVELVYSCIRVYTLSQRNNKKGLRLCHLLQGQAAQQLHRRPSAARRAAANQ